MGTEVCVALSPSSPHDDPPAQVDFGPSVGQSTSEQSVAVKGCSSFVVNNFIGVDGINDDVYCNYAQGSTQRRALDKLCSQMDVEFIEKVHDEAPGS